MIRGERLTVANVRRAGLRAQPCKPALRAPCWSARCREARRRGQVSPRRSQGRTAGRGGGEPYRIEHRKLPEFYYKSAAGEIPEQTVLPDGTVLVNETTDPTVARGKKPSDAKPFEIRRELDDGRVELHANRPEHVLTHV